MTCVGVPATIYRRENEIVCCTNNGTISEECPPSPPPRDPDNSFLDHVPGS
jgi:hypothetical protein